MKKYIFGIFGFTLVLWLLFDFIMTSISTIRDCYNYFLSWIFPHFIQAILGFLTLIVVISLLVNILKSEKNLGFILIMDGFWFILYILGSILSSVPVSYFYVMYSILGVSSLTIGIFFLKGTLHIE